MTPSENPLIGLRGIAKEIFKELGGGEAFIRSERNSFTDRDIRWPEGEER